MVDLIREKKVWSVVGKMKNKESVGLDEVLVEVRNILWSLNIVW